MIGVAVFAVSAFLASSAFFASSAFWALASDSVKTAVKSAILAASASTSAWLASAFARIALAETNASLAAIWAATSAFLAVDNFASKAATLFVKATLSATLIASDLLSTVALVDAVSDSDFPLSDDGTPSCAFDVVDATATSVPCTSVADTAPFPRNISPAAIATDAAPKLYLRIPYRIYFSTL